MGNKKNVEQILFEKYAKKWFMQPGTVHFVYETLRDAGSQYGKVSRRLTRVSIYLTARQLKYFYRKIRLTKRYGIPEDIGKENYTKLVNKQI